MNTNLLHRTELQPNTMGAETKRERFERIGKSRMQRALTAIRLVGNLSASSTYAYTTKDVTQIEEALKTAIDRAMARFHVHDAVDVDQFFFAEEEGTSEDDNDF